MNNNDCNCGFISQQADISCKKCAKMFFDEECHFSYCVYAKSHCCLSKIIYNQQELSSKKGTFGSLGNLKKNGCGAVALHNANVILGKSVLFSDVLNYFFMSFKTFWGGTLGALPCTLAKYFRKNNCKVKIYYNIKKVSNNHKAYIAFYLWKNKHNLGAHYITFKRENNLYIAYNNEYSSNENNIKAFDISNIKNISSDYNCLCILIMGIDNITK